MGGLGIRCGTRWPRHGCSITSSDWLDKLLQRRDTALRGLLYAALVPRTLDVASLNTEGCSEADTAVHEASMFLPSPLSLVHRGVCRGYEGGAQAEAKSSLLPASTPEDGYDGTEAMLCVTGGHAMAAPSSDAAGCQHEPMA